MKFTTYKATILILIFTSVTITSCFGSSNITREIDALSSQLNVTDISALNNVPLKKLRVARDSKEGTLYYAGLLWFLNDKKDYAEVAWKRSARTSKSIWKDEALRLVCYLLTVDTRYNQIMPFVDSILSPQEILEDPEVFSYYTRALWSIKDFETMATLLQTPPNFKATLRSRISVKKANFYYDMWTAIINTVKEPDNAEYNLALLFSKHSYEYTDSDFNTFLSQIPSLEIENLSEYTQSLITLRNPSITDKEAFDILRELPLEYYQNYWVTLDLLNTSNRLGARYRDRANALFEKAKKLGADNTSRGIISLAQANIAYKKNRYKKSTALYRDGLSFIDANIIDPESDLFVFTRRSQWRYLYSVIQTNSDAFFPLYIQTIEDTQTPNYFTDLLEEQLSHLLQQNSKQKIRDQFFTYSRLLTDIEQQAELLRWETILARLDPSYKIDILDVKNFPRYYSSTPFDYLVNHEQTITQDLFIKDWINDDVADTVPTSDIDKLISGYIKYGLSNYGYNVALDNVKQLSNLSIRAISEVLYSNGRVFQSLTLTRIAVAHNKKILNDKEVLQQLYPIPYFDILETITTNPIEQALMLGIMREESSFDHDIRSSANAIGLTQMLSSTAKDIAKRIDFQGPIRLTDPKTNITLGYWYFKYLIRVLETPLKAIASYNGGLGNIWKWEEKYDDSNLIVFADSLPYRETRNYIRKVASSAMIYGLLYFDIDPDDFQEFLLSK